MCVWFPLWPVQRLRSGRRGPSPALESGQTSARAPGPSRPLRPLIFFTEGRRGFEVVVYSSEAKEWGVRIGMPLGEVQSLLPCPPQRVSRPGLNAGSGSGSYARGREPGPGPTPKLRLPVLKRFDPVADRLRLQKIAQSCLGYSPLVGLEESAAPESLWLDISGSEALFAGEQGLAERVRSDLAKQGIQVRVAIADSWGAAWGASHFGEAEIALIPAGQQERVLAPLPVAALRISDSVCRSLEALDVKTIGQLLRLPRSSLPSRFGKDLVRRLDQALGLAPELLIAERLVEPLRAEWLFEDPVVDRQTLDHVCEALLEQLLAKLDQRRAGLRELACHWLGTGTEPTTLRLLRPTTDRRHLQGLLRLQCERRVFTAGVHGIRMEVVEMGLSVIRQATLFGDDEDKHPQALAELVDRLSTRLGRQGVLRMRLTTDPQPEFSYETVPWLDARGTPEESGIAVASRLRCRPLRLLRVPQPLVIQAVSAVGLPDRVHQSAVVRINGPERIETGWWRGPDLKRDYYRLDLANGTMLWVFVDRETRRWFLHGLFV
jgi:protein ImuB